MTTCMEKSCLFSLLCVSFVIVLSICMCASFSLVLRAGMGFDCVSSRSFADHFYFKKSIL